MTRQDKNSAWKPKEDSRSFKEVNSVRYLESSKIKTDVSIAVSDTGSITLLSESPFNTLGANSRLN